MFIVNLFKRVPKSDESSPQNSSSPVVNKFAISPQTFYVTRKISKSRFPIYQILLPTNNNDYAMKLYSYKNDQPQKYYNNEIRFMILDHPNVIKIFSNGDKKEILSKGQPTIFSYILMEYAPYGDFFDLIKNYGNLIDEKLIRTYFKQLKEGLDYMHKNNVAHLDLKPENLLLGSNFQLKIADFDGSHVLGDKKFLSKGTRSYRAPELANSDLNNLQLKLPFAADIYSAGIILFILKSRIYPYFEGETMNGVDLLALMNSNNKEFWSIHCGLQDESALFYSKDFKELFNGMVKMDPSQRWTIKQIKKSKWYNGPVYGNSKLQSRMNEIVAERQKL